MGKNKLVLNRLKAQLASKEMMNKTLAELLGVSEQAVSKWCTNNSQPSLQNVFKIAAYLDLPPSEIIGAKNPFVVDQTTGKLTTVATIPPTKPTPQ